MRKVLTILLCLLLLVSCATKKTTTWEPVDYEEANVPEVEETIAPEEITEEVSTEEQVVAEEVQEVDPFADFVPEESDLWAEFVTADLEEETSEDLGNEVPDVEEPVETETATEDSSTEDDASILEDLGNFVFTAESAPSEEPLVEADVVEEESPLVSVEPVVETVPITEVETVEVVPEKVQENLSFVDKLTDFATKAGDFIMREKLLSAGILSIFIGVIYLIAALIKSSERRTSAYSDRYYGYSDDIDDEEEKVEVKHRKKSKVDLDLSDEDDDFLKSLLGNDEER